MDYKWVYSLWTEPSGDIRTKALNWVSPKAHLYSWVLSVMKAKEFTEELELVTDDLGVEILINDLELPFTSVKNILNGYSEYKDFWAFGKIKAYEIQDKPFIHMDADAFLWNGIPDKIKNKEVFAQNIEDKEWFKDAYKSQINHLESKNSFNKTDSWGEVEYAYCTGLFGGTDIDFINKYAKEAISFLDRNKEVFKDIDNKGCYCVIFEQYLLACAAKKENKNVYCLEKDLNKDNLALHRYTHIWGEKKNKDIEKILGDIVKRDYPKQYKIIANYGRS